MTTRTFVLREPQTAYKALQEAWQWAKAMMMAGNPLILEIKPISKTRDQEEKYHAIIGEISKQAEHLGSKWTDSDWKRLLLDQFARDTGRQPGRIIPSLDRSGVVEVGIQSRRFSRQEGSEFIEFLHAWAATNGVELSQ